MSEQARSRRGRPPVLPPGKRTRIQVTFSAQQKAKLERLAGAAGCRVPDVLRALVDAAED